MLFTVVLFGPNSYHPFDLVATSFLFLNDVAVMCPDMVRLMLEKAGLRVVREAEHDPSNSYYNRQGGGSGIGLGLRLPHGVLVDGIFSGLYSVLLFFRTS